MIGYIHERVTSIHIISFHFEIEDILRCLIGTILSSLETSLLTNFDKASAWTSKSCQACANSNFSKFGRRSMTCLRYASMPLSFFMKLPLTQITTSQESLFMRIFFTCISLANLKLAKRDLYSVTLFETLNFCGLQSKPRPLQLRSLFLQRIHQQKGSKYKTL